MLMSMVTTGGMEAEGNDDAIGVLLFPLEIVASELLQSIVLGHPGECQSRADPKVETHTADGSLKSDVSRH
jgi:hypothetical protein